MSYLIPCLFKGDGYTDIDANPMPCGHSVADCEAWHLQDSGLPEPNDYDMTWDLYQDDLVRVGCGCMCVHCME